MKTSFLEMIKDICDEIGLQPPVSLNESKNQDIGLIRLMKAQAKRLAQSLMGQTVWKALIKEIPKGIDATSIEDFGRFVGQSQTHYMSDFWIRSQEGTEQKEFIKDSDYVVFPQEIFCLGLKWKLWESKGLQYGQIYQEYEQKLANAIAKEQKSHFQKENLDLASFDGSTPSGGTLHPTGL